MQRRLGLYLSGSDAALDAKAARGEVVDRLGDDLCNEGEHGKRHDGVNRSFYDMLTAVASGPVILGDKE